jgi:hypothetical protein
VQASFAKFSHQLPAPQSSAVQLAAPLAPGSDQVPAAQGVGARTFSGQYAPAGQITESSSTGQYRPAAQGDFDPPAQSSVSPHSATLQSDAAEAFL